MIPELRTNLVDRIGKYASLRKVAAHEWASPCPRCGGSDRFRVNDEKGWFCRTCQGEPGSGGHWGDYADFMQFLSGWTLRETLHSLGMDRKLTPAEIAALDTERKAAQEKARAEEFAKQSEVHSRLTSGNWQRYHDNLNSIPEARAMWNRRGLSDGWIDFYHLGYCLPRDWWGKFFSDSLTIPYLRIDNGAFRVVNLKHRILIDNPPMGKYLPELSGAGSQLFYANYYDPTPAGKNLLIVEGEIKAMVTWSCLGETGYWPAWSVIGIPGHGWREEWVHIFNLAERVFICLDPDGDAQRAAKRLVNCMADRAKNILLPEKIDDLIAMNILDGSKLVEILEG